MNDVGTSSESIDCVHLNCIPRMAGWVCLVFCIVAGQAGWSDGEAVAPGPEASSPPHFDLPETNETQSGQMKLKWLVEGQAARDSDHRFEVQQSKKADFGNHEVLYIGPDYATYLSGMPNGTYHYRVRLVDGADRPLSEWSSVVRIVVAPPSSLSRLYPFSYWRTCFLIDRGRCFARFTYRRRLILRRRDRLKGASF